MRISNTYNTYTFAGSSHFRKVNTLGKRGRILYVYACYNYGAVHGQTYSIHMYIYA